MLKTIAEMRKEASLTQDYVASTLAISQASVSQWERGESRPDLKHIPEIAKMFGVTTDDIIAAITAAKEQIN